MANMSSSIEGEDLVIIVGAGPSGLATAACLSNLSIPYIILEREDCFASIWKKYAYDRLHLHLAKQFCELPHMPFPSTYPKYISKEEFLKYLDSYVAHFKIAPLYQRYVESAIYDETTRKWNVKVRNGNVIEDHGRICNDHKDSERIKGSESASTEEYVGGFLVVATGETSDAFIPEIKGIETFNGEFLHSTRYRNGEKYREQKVLVVGSGNSGMEIAFDLANHGAKTSVVVRGPLHILSRGMASCGLMMLKYLPLNLVDSVLVMLSKIVYGDLRNYGITRLQEGPFFCKEKYGKYPVIDVGTYNKIKSGEIQVLPAITSIKGNDVIFENGNSYQFDVIIFATGFKRSTSQWLKGYSCLLNDDGLPRLAFPNHWKGKNRLYCAGLARKGLYGATMDALHVASDIKNILSSSSFKLP